MIETPQPQSVAGFKPPRSPEMTPKVKKGPSRKSLGRSTSGGTTKSSSTKQSLPPRPPIIVTAEEKSPSERPPSHLQLTSSEDLSFADFSNLEDDDSSLYEDQQQYASLSGFLDGDKAACLTSAPVFRRQRKVNAVDVASVGNASDTQISVNHHNNNQSQYQHVSGRDLHEKAKLAFNAGDYSTALPMFESILSAQVRRFSPLHPSVGAAMHNVGVCRQRLGQHALAENLFEEAVQIRKQTLGVDHLEVAASLSKLGAAQTALRKFDEAFDHLRTALKIAKKQVGPEHKTVAQMLCHLACLYFEAGELMSAEATFQDALEIYRSVWSSSTDRDACMTQLTDTLCNVGSIQNRRKRFSEAVTSFSEALDLQRGIVGHDDPRIISTLDNLGYSYSKLKDYSASLSCYRKMYRAQVSNAGTFTNACFETFRKEVLMYEKLKRYQEAITETKETLQMERSMLPADHVLIAHTKDLLEELKQKLRRSSDS